MKKALIVTSCLIASLGMTMMAYAQSSSSSTATSGSTAPSVHARHHHGHGACMNIASACEMAGFRLGKNMPGKNIWKDCVNPLLEGKTISGVTADPKDIQVCKAHKSEWKQKHNEMTAPSTTTSTTTHQ